MPAYTTHLTYSTTTTTNTWIITLLFESDERSIERPLGRLPVTPHCCAVVDADAESFSFFLLLLLYNVAIKQ
jgi:hypothetical protein